MQFAGRRGILVSEAMKMWLDNLRKMKSASGLTTKQVASQSGIPEPTLEKLFAGATKDPKLTTLSQLVHFFGYTLDDLESPLEKIKKSPDAEIPAPRDEMEYLIVNLVRQLDDGQKDFLISLLEKVISRTQSERVADPD